MVTDENRRELLLIDTEGKVKVIKKEFYGSNWFGRSIRIDESGEFLFINEDDKVIRLIKGIGTTESQERLCDKVPGEYIKDFGPLRNNRLAILTDNGFLSIFKYDFESKEEKNIFELKSVYQIVLDKTDEISNTLAICPKSTYICVSSRRITNFNQRNLFLFKIVKNSELWTNPPKKDQITAEEASQINNGGEMIQMLHRLNFDHYDFFSSFHSICFAFNLEEKPILFGLQYSGNRELYSFSMDDKETLVEFMPKVEEYSDSENVRLSKRDNQLYSISRKGQIQILTWQKKVGKC